jgi:hypothetical protein
MPAGIDEVVVLLPQRGDGRDPTARGTPRALAVSSQSVDGLD